MKFQNHEEQLVLSKQESTELDGESVPVCRSFDAAFAVGELPRRLGMTRMRTADVAPSC